MQLYTQHQYPVTAVAMAPSGCYMATGDSSGCLRIWACDTPEQILKGEYPMLAGAISDIDWSPDNARIVLVGEGMPPAKVIMWDSGNSVGDVSGHIKKISTVSYKPTRPFRVITGSDDLKVNFYEGPPFKFKGTSKTHERYPNCVRYSPDGAKFFSVGSDMARPHRPPPPAPRRGEATARSPPCARHAPMPPPPLLPRRCSRSSTPRSRR